MTQIAPITPDFLTSQIVAVDYFNPKPTLTLCVLTMSNGLYVVGKSAVLDPKRFDAEIGRDVAYKNAFEQLWQLEGYARASAQAAARIKVTAPSLSIEECERLKEFVNSDAFRAALVAKVGTR